jgi:hypothetical protein
MGLGRQVVVRIFGGILLIFSWLVLLTASLGALVGAWLYFGYIKVECHPMFVKVEAECGILQTWASEHVIIVGREMMLYRQVLADQQALLIFLVGAGISTALLMQLLHRALRIRRKRRLGLFSDVKGFRPIDM